MPLAMTTRTGDPANARHVAITGASSGIGAALAVAFAAPGIHLTLIGRDPQRLDAVVDACTAKGATAQGCIVDVTDAETMARLLLAADDVLAIDILVANAGLGGKASMAAADGEEPAMAAAVAAVNFMGVIHTVAPLVPRFAARGTGRIGIVSSMAADALVPLAPTYAGAKAGAAAYARNLRLFLKPRGVSVTLVMPGFVDTPMSADVPGPKPGLWSAERAAQRIHQGIERGEALVAFPLSMRVIVSLSRLAPDALITQILRRWRAD
jgi:short-subunit dehydrogenase